MRRCIFSVHHSLACATMAVAASCHVVGCTDGVTSRRWRSVHMCVPFTYCTAAAVVGRRVASHKSSRRCSPKWQSRREEPPSPVKNPARRISPVRLPVSPVAGHAAVRAGGTSSRGKPSGLIGRPGVWRVSRTHWRSRDFWLGRGGSSLLLSRLSRLKLNLTCCCCF